MMHYSKEIVIMITKMINTGLIVTGTQTHAHVRHVCPTIYNLFFYLWIRLLSHCPNAAVEEEEEDDENIHDSAGDSQTEQLNDASF